MAHYQDVIELRRKRAGLVKQMEDVLNKAKEENRGLSVDEDTMVNKIITDEEGLAKEIRNLEWLEDKNKSLEGHENRFKANHEENKGKQEYRDVFKKWIQGGTGSLEAEERQLLFSNRAQDGEQRALASGTGSAGGFTVPQGFYDTLTEAMKAYGGMREVAYTLNTETGAPLPFPTVNETSNIGEIIAENGTVTQQDPTFAQLTLGAYKYSSKMVLVPIELLQDSAFDIETWLAKALGTRIARITNTHFTTGSGTAQPRGVVTDAASGKVGATGQTTSVTYDDIVDLIHSVDPALRNNAKFMLHDTSVRNLKKLKDTTGAPLWVPGVAYKEQDTIAGYGYTVNQDMPTMAASAKSILFGDFSNYFIRNVMNVSTIRFGEKFMDSGQVGFLAFSRQDGRLIHGGVNPVSFYQNSAT